MAQETKRPVKTLPRRGLSIPPGPLRLWPAVVAVAMQWLVVLVAPLVVSGDTTPYLALAGVFGALAIVVWWVFFSRAPRFERWGGVLLIVAALVATFGLVHESIRAGAMGFQLFIYLLPVLSLAFVAWAGLSRRLAAEPRWAALVAALVLACVGWTLVRSDGVTGDGGAEFAWRWAQTPEERLLAGAGPGLPVSAPAASSPRTLGETVPGAVWPGFRGRDRSGAVRGISIETDWARTPPVELWRRPIGPGWSSFAVAGDLLYTQEQRGDDEVVACYKATTGEPVWSHRDRARFWQSESGAGPLATPALSDGRLYTLGGTGILNALDALDGTVLWSRNAAADTGAEVPHWGFSSSPLVVDDVVIVHAGRLVAYDPTTGEPRWWGPEGGESHSSPHLLTLDGVAQVLMLSANSMISVAPADGSLLWEHSWPGWSILQPALAAEGDVVVSRMSATGMAAGLRRIAVAPGPEGWTTVERWTSTRLKPHSSDFVVHEGHTYGFDGRILACIDLENGERRWKGGRYGSGQLLLLADQDLLLVISERGELALVVAKPDQFTELARFPALGGKTWNHPVLVGDLLLVRNAQEMAAFQLPLAGR